MPTWPSSLPQIFDDDGYQETPPNLLIRTKTDAGPHKVRRRRTAGITTISGMMTMTRLQAKVLWDFFMKDCNAGEQLFDWTTTNVSTGDLAAGSYRFARPPRFGSTDGFNFRATLDLELMQ